MTTVRFPLYAASGANRTLKSVVLMASTAVASSASTYVVMKIGVAGATGVGYVATHDGSKTSLRPGVSVTLYAPQTPLILLIGQEVVADVTFYQYGTALVSPYTFQVTAGHNLTDYGQRVSDPGVRTAFDALQAFLVGVGAGDHVVVVPLRDP